MAKNFQVIEISLDPTSFHGLSKRQQRQLVGCMHAHNELAVLNRIVMFAMNSVGDGELHDSAQSIQMWSLLHVLSGKIFEAWKMVDDRFLKADTRDLALSLLSESQNESLQWLKEYFSESNRNSSLRIIRDKAAFHYDNLPVEQELYKIAPGENLIYIAEHPANSLYYFGSAIFFRNLFGIIADKNTDTSKMNSNQRTLLGFNMAYDDAKNANWNLHMVLCGLVYGLLKEKFDSSLNAYQRTRINILDAPQPEQVGLPMFIDIGTDS